MYQEQKVIQLATYRPHLEGKAHCLLCKTEWLAICPIGTMWLECPECHSMKGCMKGSVERQGYLWTCDCGNTLFHISPEGNYCPNCGNWQKGY